MAHSFVVHRQVGAQARTWVWALARTCGLVVLTMGAGNGVSTAAEWSAAPSLSGRGVYNSNLLLNDGENEVIGYWITPAVKFKGATEVFDVEAETRADFVSYYGKVDREFTNVFFPLRTSYRLDRHAFGFEGGFTRDNTLRGELVDTGLVVAFAQRNMWTAMPTWKMGITERLSWLNSYQFIDASYEDGLRFGLVDYQVNGGNSGVTYNVGEVDQLQVTGEYTSVRMPFIGLTSMYYGGHGGWTHDFGEGLIGSISGGARVVRSTQAVPAIPGILGILLGRTVDQSVSSQDVVLVYRASLRKELERGSIRIEGSREINPSGFGRLLQSDRVKGSFSHRVSETLSVAVDGAIYFVSGVTTTSASRPLATNRVFSISPTLTWKFAQWWELGVGYSYAERAVDDLDLRHNAHSTFIMLTYGGEKWSVSR